MSEEATETEPNDVEESGQEQETESLENDEVNEAEEAEDAGEKFDAERAREKIRKLNSESKNLRKRAAEAEEKAKGAGEKDEKLTALEAENLRLKIGIKHGLPESVLKRLSGNTEEELLQDAEELMELFAGSKKPPTNRPKEQLRGGTDPTGEPDEQDLDKLAGKIFR